MCHEQPAPSSPNYLIVENDNDYIEGIYKPAQRDHAREGRSFELEYARTIEEARGKLATHRFDGVILDIRLAREYASTEGTPNGNQIARQIYRDHCIPIAIVSGFTNDVDPDIEKLKDEGSAFLEIFAKGGDIRKVFDFLLKIYKSGILDIIGPSGEINKMVSDIFWTHLGQVMKRWIARPLSTEDHHRVIRHTIAHMFNALQTTKQGTDSQWDKYHPDEIYFVPSVCDKEATGDIYKKNNPAVGTAEYYLLVTQICDIAKGIPYRHLIKINPSSVYASKLPNIISKKDYRCHFIPESTQFPGGVLDFALIQGIPEKDLAAQYTRHGSLAEPFWREINVRLGMWFARQGTPEVEATRLG